MPFQGNDSQGHSYPVPDVLLFVLPFLSHIFPLKRALCFTLRSTLLIFSRSKILVAGGRVIALVVFINIEGRQTSRQNRDVRDSLENEYHPQFCECMPSQITLVISASL